MISPTRPRAGGHRALLALAAALCLSAAAPTRAQMITTGATSDRPYRALFGGAAPTAQGPQSLTLTGAVFAGYDDDIFARGAGPGGGANRPRVGGEFLGSQLSLAYQRRYATSTVAATAATANRYLASSKDFVQTFASGTVSLQGTPRPRTSYALQQSLSYRPFFTPSLFAPASTIGPSVGGDTDGPLIDDVGGGVPDDFTLASDRDGLRASTVAQVQRNLT